MGGGGLTITSVVGSHSKGEVQEGQIFYGYKHPLKQAWGEGGGGGGPIQKINKMNSCSCIRNTFSGHRE